MPQVAPKFKKLEWSLSGLTGAFQCVILLWAILPCAHSQTIPTGFNVQRYASVWERNPFTLVKAPASQVQSSTFEKLYLASWLIEGGKEVISVENSETKELQRIAAEPNQNNMRLIELHLNLNPRFVDAVISDGNEQGTVKFRYDDQLIHGPTTPTLTQVGAGDDSLTSSLRPVNPPHVQTSKPASWIYPGIPRVHSEGGPRQQTARSRFKHFLPDPATQQSNNGQN